MVDANRRTLLRRVTLTLIGLVPSPEELAAFEKNQAPDAYEQQVDRLLASPLYGQRMASDWLDLARYADTHGYHADTERQQWRWRDWVIEQLNAGQPFDQFALEQLAGDLLPNATLMQRIATGFNRNHRMSGENGAIPEELLAEHAIDRVVTTGTAFLGQTFVCARCHDHKYEALSQRELYGMVAFFNSLDESPLLNDHVNAYPRLQAPTREQQAELDQLAFRLASTQSAQQQRAVVARADQERWEKEATAGKIASPPAAMAIHLPLDKADKNKTTDLARPFEPAAIEGAADFSTGKFDDALLGDGGTFLKLANWPALTTDQSWTLSAWVFPTTRDELVITAQVDDVLFFRGIEWSLVDGQLQLRFINRAGSDERIFRSQETTELSRWQHLAVVFDAKKPSEPQFWKNGRRMEIETTGKMPAAPISTASPLRIGGLTNQVAFRGMLDEIRLYARPLSPSEIELLAGGNPIAEIVKLPADKRTAEQQQTLARYYLEHHDAEHQRLSTVLQSLRSRRDLLLKLLPSVLVSQELPQPRPTFVLMNGQYDHPGERVARQTPAYLSQQAKLLRTDRLGFARWLIDPQHPLTGRVAVNRAWQQVFGKGLVATPEDFGVRGAKPAQQELLDWLAREYVDTGWDTKRLHRQLVNSTTFRQQSFPRQRLSAEVIRDVALQSAGVINYVHGGPGVKPYQPGDLWKELSYYPNDLSAQLYNTTSGSAMYRRSVYLFWKRNAPPVNLTTFDAPNRETCTVERSRTNTPLQALVLLNDPTFVEAARLLATRILAGKDQAADARLNRLFQIVLSRPATAGERELLQQQLAADLAHYQANPAEAKKLLDVGQAAAPLDISAAELAAWTNLATVVLNLDEALTNH
ncbi:DUF1553 domain-containing protein [Anatilimnocola floriformis]|uniref:DUF1553 domain-containing protein n=1 Tax=Anatilimnocola floriformis TaxID=2948575 RepID=UPI0020C3FD77|nr:DUF1553 domain-containing protein [Anatilimnocola floriformis]